MVLWLYDHIVATSPLALRWMCDSSRTGCARRITPIFMWHKQTITEWSRRVNSIVVCCHSVKLCALAARAFRSQQYTVSGVQRGGTERRALASKVGCHPKGEITKIKMLCLDDFSYCKATNTCYMDLIFRNLFFVKFLWFSHSSIPRTCLLSCTAHTQSNW